MERGLTKLTGTQLANAVSPGRVTEADLQFYQAAAETILGAYPNAGIADESAYLDNLRETLCGMGREYAEDLADKRSGIITVCKFPPTMAEMHEFIKPALEAERMRQDREAQQARIDAFMADDKPIPQSDKEYVKAGFKKLAADLKASAPKQENKIGLDPRTHCKSGDAIRAQMASEPVKDREET